MRRRQQTIKSMLTEGSAASIFAIRDWLEPNTRPSCSCVNLRRLRCSLTALASPTFSSMMAVSLRHRCVTVDIFGSRGYLGDPAQG